MVALLLRLLALSALFLMPFGMSVPAAAQAGGQMHAIEGSCDAGAPAKHSNGKVPQVHCAAACTALPAALPGLAMFSIGAEPPAPQRSASLDGKPPELATPPPKLS